MSTRLQPAAVAGLGLFLLAGAAVAVVAGALAPAAVFGSAGLAHVAVGAGLRARSRSASAIGTVVGIADLALVGAAIAFILGIETGIGVDLGARWFAPLNGYATVAVATAISAIGASLVVTGARAIAGAGPRRPASQ